MTGIFGPSGAFLPSPACPEFAAFDPYTVSSGRRGAPSAEAELGAHDRRDLAAVGAAARLLHHVADDRRRSPSCRRRAASRRRRGWPRARRCDDGRRARRRRRRRRGPRPRRSLPGRRPRRRAVEHLLGRALRDRLRARPCPTSFASAAGRRPSRLAGSSSPRRATQLVDPVGDDLRLGVAGLAARERRLEVGRRARRARRAAARSRRSARRRRSKRSLARRPAARASRRGRASSIACVIATGTQVGLGEVAVVVRLLLGAQRRDRLGPRVEVQRLLHDLLARAHDAPPGARSRRGCPRSMKRKEFMFLSSVFVPSSVCADRADGDVGVAAQRALLHVHVADAELAQRRAQQPQPLARLLGRAHVGLGDDLDQRRAAAVEVDDRGVGRRGCARSRRRARAWPRPPRGARGGCARRRAARRGRAARRTG